MSSSSAIVSEIAEHTTPKSLAGWSRWLCEQEMPIFSRTAQRINQAVVDEKAGTLEISTIILQDPTLTARVLKLSNSSVYNPARLKVDTISRALVILGYKTVSELTLACTFIESIVVHGNKERVNREIGRALHAAVQAKCFAQIVNDPAPEEIFIAALLKNLGRIAFFCFDKDGAEKIETRRIEKGWTQDQAERSVLGFSLTQLGSSLSRIWQLGGLIDETISGAESDSGRVELVNVSHEIAEASELGWEETKFQRCLDKVETLTCQSKTKLVELIQESATSAAKIASQFGAQDAVQYIPSKTEGAAVARQIEQKATTYNNAEMELQILQDITSALIGQIKINEIFEMVMEGIHRGVGMDRTLFTLLSPDRTSLNEKSALGWLNTSKHHPIRMPVVGPSPNLFSHAIGTLNSMWIRPGKKTDIDRLFTSQVLAQFGRQECFLGRLAVGPKIVGLFYADRGLSSAELDQKSFDSFKHFVQQANLALTLSQTR